MYLGWVIPLVVKTVLAANSLVAKKQSTEPGGQAERPYEPPESCLGFYILPTITLCSVKVGMLSAILAADQRFDGLISSLRRHQLRCALRGIGKLLVVVGGEHASATDFTRVPEMNVELIKCNGLTTVHLLQCAVWHTGFCASFIMVSEQHMRSSTIHVTRSCGVGRRSCFTHILSIVIVAVGAF